MKKKTPGGMTSTNQGTPQPLSISEFTQRKAQERASVQEQKPEKKSLLGRAARFIAPTATGLVTGEKKVTGRTLLGAGLEIGSFFIPAGAAARGIGLAAKGAKAAKAVSLARKVKGAAKAGAAAGGTFEAGRAIGEEDTGIGEIAKRTAFGAVTGGAVGGAIPIASRSVSSIARRRAGGLAARPTTASQAQEAAGKILQAEKREAIVGTKVLGKVDTRGVKTFDDLSSVLEANVDRTKNLVDQEFAKNAVPIKAKDLAQTVTADAGGRQVKSKMNFVNAALDDLEELFTKTRSPADKLGVQAIKRKAKSVGLTPTEINQVARDYGTTFKRKAFNKKGDPLTSVNATTFENTRKGIKDTARSFLPDDAAKALDKDISEMLRVKISVDTMLKKVNALEQRVTKRNLVEKLSRGLGQVVDIATFGGPKAFISKLFFPSNVGQKTMNSLDIQKHLAKNLKIIRSLENASDETIVATLKKLAKELGITRSNTVFGGKK